MLIHAAKSYRLYVMCKKFTFPADPVIKQYGGVGALADALGYEYQRVHNWIQRGIPPYEIATRPDIFAAAAKVGADSAAQHEANTRASGAAHKKLDLERLA